MHYIRIIWSKKVKMETPKQIASDINEARGRDFEHFYTLTFEEWNLINRIYVRIFIRLFIIFICIFIQTNIFPTIRPLYIRPRSLNVCCHTRQMFWNFERNVLFNPRVSLISISLPFVGFISYLLIPALFFFCIAWSFLWMKQNI